MLFGGHNHFGDTLGAQPRYGHRDLDAGGRSRLREEAAFRSTARLSGLTVVDTPCHSPKVNAYLKLQLPDCEWIPLPMTQTGPVLITGTAGTVGGFLQFCREAFATQIEQACVPSDPDDPAALFQGGPFAHPDNRGGAGRPAINQGAVYAHAKNT